MLFRSGRRRDSLGQGRGPDAADAVAGFVFDFMDMPGVWLDLEDGGRGLVVATAIILRTAEELLLVEMRGGGPRRLVPWADGHPTARLVPGARKEFVDVGLPTVAVGEMPGGTYRHGQFIDAMVRVGSRSDRSTLICIYFL